METQMILVPVSKLGPNFWEFYVIFSLLNVYIT